VGYRRAKAVKAGKKALDAGKIVKKSGKKSVRPTQKTQSRTEEMQELFQSDMSEKKQKRNVAAGKKKSKKSFKSKSRYELACNPFHLFRSDCSKAFFLLFESVTSQLWFKLKLRLKLRIKFIVVEWLQDIYPLPFDWDLM
jgi:hypothetical protein